MKLKELLSTLLLICTINLSLGQVEFPVLDATWCYDGYGDLGENLGIDCFSPSELVELNGKVYSKVSFRPHPYSSYRDILYREEDRRFYVIPQDSTNEILLYDFNLEVGDTYQATYGYGPTEPVDLVVQDVEMVETLDGILRKKITLSKDEYYGTWIEGIGQLEWVFLNPSYVLSVSGGYGFSCHAVDGDVIYPEDASGQNCDIIDNTVEAKISTKVEVYPNPVRDKITIDFNNIDCDKLKILDLSGKVVFEKNINLQNESFVLLSSLKAGAYFIQIFFKDGRRILTKKLIKI